jgi:hypothetical protein
MAHLRYWRRSIDESDDGYGNTLEGKYFIEFSNQYSFHRYAPAKQ